MESNTDSIQKITQKLSTILDIIIQYGYYREVLTDNGYHYLFADTMPAFIFLNYDNAHLVPLPQEDRRQLVNLATAIYLAIWLANDRNAKQTIHGFSMQGFRALNEREQNADDYLKQAYRSRLEAAEGKYHVMRQLQKMKAEREGFCRSEDAKPLKKKDNKLEDVENESPNGGIWYDFTSLCFLDWISEGKFALYNLLVYRKKLLTIVGKKDKSEKLRDAYKSYLSHVAKLNEDPDNKLYTISSIMLHNLETSFHHTLAPAFAFSIDASQNMTMDTAIGNTYYFWGRYTYQSQFWGDELKKYILQKKGMSDSAWSGTAHDRNWDVHLFRELMNLISENYASHYLPFLCRLLIKRGILIEMVNLISGSDEFYPPDMPSWTSADYSSAADFFRKDYPIIENHLLFDFPPPDEWPDSVCDNIRKFYEFFQDHELEYLRREAQRSQKARNRKKSKS